MRLFDLEASCYPEVSLSLTGKLVQLQLSTAAMKLREEPEAVTTMVPTVVLTAVNFAASSMSLRVAKLAEPRGVEYLQSVATIATSRASIVTAEWAS